MASDVILRARGVTKAYGGLRAVDGVDLEVERGRLVGLIGPNGAGKSTFFHCLSGFVPLDAGEVSFKPRGGSETAIGALPAHRRARMGLVRTFQISRVLGRMTVLENLLVAPPGQTGEGLAGAFAFWAVKKQDEELERRAMETLRYFRLDHLAEAYAGSLSGGQRKLLELARALMAGPEMILLDEPMAGVNPTLARELMDRIEDLRRERGMTFLLVEHDMEAVFGYCDPIVVMAQGRKLAEGSADEVRENRAVREAYLGV